MGRTSGPASVGSPSASSPRLAYQTNYSSDNENSLRLGVTSKGRASKIIILAASTQGLADAQANSFVGPIATHDYGGTSAGTYARPAPPANNTHHVWETECTPNGTGQINIATMIYAAFSTGGVNGWPRKWIRFDCAVQSAMVSRQPRTALKASPAPGAIGSGKATEIAPPA